MKQQVQRRPRGGWFIPTVSLLLLLLAPGAAVARLGHMIEARLLAGYVAFISLLTFVMYWHDKRQAQLNTGDRTPEASLHAAEMLGGWPAAFLAQRLVRHKIAKREYQVAFWFIVLIHQAVAVEFLLDWRFSRGAWEIIAQWINSAK